MIDAFVYDWNELTRGRRLTIKLVLQAIVLAVIVGFGPDLILMLAGYGSEISAYQFKFMAVVIPVVVGVSVLSYRNNPVMDVTTSSLLIDKDVVRVTRHVISETGRRFFAVWDSMEVKGYRVDEVHRIIQVDAKWKVSAYRMRGKEPGSFVDSDIRSHTQTFQLKPEAFFEASAYLQEHCFNITSAMTKEEYEKAKPFIHKHYEL